MKYRIVEKPDSVIIQKYVPVGFLWFKKMKWVSMVHRPMLMYEFYVTDYETVKNAKKAISEFKKRDNRAERGTIIHEAV